MQANDIGDIIARFIGSFEVMTDADRLRQTYEDFLAARAKDHAFEDGETHASKGSALGGQAPHDPDLDVSPGHFRIEHVRSLPLHVGDIEIEIPDLGRLHQGGHVYKTVVDIEAGASGHASSLAASHGRFGSASHGENVRPDGEVSYQNDTGSSLVAIRQDATLLDDDVFSAVDGVLPSALPDGLAAELAELTARAEAWSQGPEATNDVASIKDLLTVSASEPSSQDEVAPGAGLAAHAGLYVNGEAAATAPDLVEILKTRFDPEPAETPESGVADDGSSVATVSLGGNLLLNQTVLIQAATFGYTSVVLGDYHETNVIRQLNIVADGDVVFTREQGAFAGDGAQTYNAAYFERMDPVSEGPGLALSAFPRSYVVDVVEGDLFVSNFIRQIHKVSDNDSALFTTVEHGASIVMGGNEVLHFASLNHLTVGYDLVVFGGSVFEGNFIEQINLLFDRDRIGGDGAFEEGTSGQTGGNLLYNKASILTVGTDDAFGDVDPAIRDLVASFEAGDGTISASLSSDLSFLGATYIKVLYVTGDYVEINAISQVNILSDADSASYVDALIGELTSDEAVWTVSTGDNILVNDATILDADAAGPRQLGGEYYSDSILIQADLVSDGEGIEVFDTGKLASELVAFTVEDTGGTCDGDGHHHAGAAYDAPTDGVAGILI